MRLLICLVLIATVSGCAVAGPPTAFSEQAVQSQINKTLWRPFKAAFENLDGAALNALYADQVLRVTPDGIDTANQFKGFNQTRFAENVANGDRIELEFWFDSRQTAGSVSYEVGFYRLRVVSRAGTPSDFYGQFHIVLKRIDGAWRIVQDWDTDVIGGRALSAVDFERRAPAQL
ncbi:MAG: DUF4440 domain-containing protein [Pseudomonadales bacterium]